MRHRILFVMGLAAGYVVGARAGRSAYDSVVERVRGVTANPKVQQVGEKAKQTLEENAPEVADAAKKAATAASDAVSAAAAAGAASSDGSPEPAEPTAPASTTPPQPAETGTAV